MVPVGFPSSYVPFLFLVHSPLDFHSLSPLLHAHCVYLHFDRSQLFYGMFSPCNASLYDDKLARLLLPRRHLLSPYSKPPKSTYFASLFVRWPCAARSSTCSGSDMPSFATTATSLWAHPERLGITSGTTSDAMLKYHWDVQRRLLRPCYVSRAQDISLLISVALLMANTCVT